VTRRVWCGSESMLRWLRSMNCPSWVLARDFPLGQRGISAPVAEYCQVARSQCGPRLDGCVILGDLASAATMIIARVVEQCGRKSLATTSSSCLAVLVV
jgi:hypothetical protein